MTQTFLRLVTSYQACLEGNIRTIMVDLHQRIRCQLHLYRRRISHRKLLATAIALALAYLSVNVSFLISIPLPGEQCEAADQVESVQSQLCPPSVDDQQFSCISIQQQLRSHCGYQSCPKGLPGMLNVHLIPHSHDDVGWLKTVDQYYYGARDNIQKAGVRYIIESYMDELLKDKSRRFVQVETAFLKMWWDRQDERTKSKYRQLVEEGRVELAGGGWSMNDEATTHYSAIIDNMAWGWRFLEESFGQCGRPKVAWQIDTFGHSRQQAALFAQAGLDAMFFARLDHRDWQTRIANKSLEMIWRTKPDNKGPKYDLFTGILYDHYDPPPGFCFDILCQDSFVDDMKSPEFNANVKVATFIRLAKAQAKAYRTNHIMVTMGDDFHYQQSSRWYSSLDKLITWTNTVRQVKLNDTPLNVFYSTPSCYLKAVNEAGIRWPRKEDDFFPYARDPDKYWTGFYTSRPTLKGYVRSANSLLQAVKQMTAYYHPAPKEVMSKLNKMRNALGVVLHHDAITGTAKQHVTDDYYRILSDAIYAGQDIFTWAAVRALQPKENQPPLQYGFCPRLNISECYFTEMATDGHFVITVYNPLARPQSPLIAFPIKGLYGNFSDQLAVYEITGPLGERVDHAVLPVPESVLALPERNSTATVQVYFAAKNLPPMGFASYHVTITKGSFQNFRETYSSEIQLPRSTSAEADEMFHFRNEHYVLTLDKFTGNINSLALEGEPETAIRLRHQFLVSKSPTSGAYIFAPAEAHLPLAIGERLNVTYTRGNVVSEIRTTAGNWASLVIRMREDSPVLEFEWTVGPIPFDDGVSKEVISMFSTDIASNGTFYTDSNGKMNEKRSRDHRSTFNMGEDDKQTISRNYYPVVSRIQIRDESGDSPNQRRQLTVLTDRSQGGTSRKDGHLELLIHRRLLRDDGLGMGEGLDEHAHGQGLVAKGVYKLILSTVTNAPNLYREIELQSFHKPQVAFVRTSLSADDWLSLHNGIVSALKDTLPPSLNVLTLEPWHDGKILLRIEHLYEPEEDPKLSRPVTVHLLTILNLEVGKVEETDLFGSKYPETGETRLKWQYDDGLPDFDLKKKRLQASSKFLPGTDEDIASGIIVVQPSEIRTFLLTLR